MERVITEGGEVDRCTSCKGIWFDILEYEDLQKYAKAIDVGSEETGMKYNKTDRINCPVCPNTPLVRMVDNDQPHIWFESCSTCHGRFFDAGEFRDLSEKTISDFIKRFSVKERK
jgi:Zn-finger nucleic acid-binding protein